MFFSPYFQQADQDNEQRKRLEIAAQNANNKTNEDVAKRNKINQKKQQVIFFYKCNATSQTNRFDNCLVVDVLYYVKLLYLKKIVTFLTSQ